MNRRRFVQAGLAGRPRTASRQASPRLTCSRTCPRRFGRASAMTSHFPALHNPRTSRPLSFSRLRGVRAHYRTGPVGLRWTPSVKGPAFYQVDKLNKYWRVGAYVFYILQTISIRIRYHQSVNQVTGL